MLAQIDIQGRETVQQLDQAKRSDLGQFFTPYKIARFMASLFQDYGREHIRLLDAGAGVGSLTAAFLERFGNTAHKSIETLAYEFDIEIFPTLKSNLHEYARTLSKKGVSVIPEVIEGDFIQEGVVSYMFGRHKPADFAILNPPYRKINTDSQHRRLLSRVGIETVNLYSGFVALALLHLKEGGELVAIIPRSFCNGLYYRPFREFLLSRASIKQIHIFEARNKAFKEDGVLQENIIIHLTKGAPQCEVKISSSSDDSFDDYSVFTLPFEKIVLEQDTEKFIHIPSTENGEHLAHYENFTCSLSDIGVEISTGPVVDFRVKEFLRNEPEAGAAPLLYPAHFGEKNINWPKPNFKKSNAIIIAPETKKQLYPSGCYTIVRRFSAKEEKRRIVARLVTPKDVEGEYIGFENHLNVFHSGKKGLPQELALGLAVYLNSTLIDDYFRQFNGHTQVNATDLRLLKYPSRTVLVELGKWSASLPDFDQSTIDEKVSSIL